MPVARTLFFDSLEECRAAAARPIVMIVELWEGHSTLALRVELVWILRYPSKPAGVRSRLATANRPIRDSVSTTIEAVQNQTLSRSDATRPNSELLYCIVELTTALQINSTFPNHASCPLVKDTAATPPIPIFLHTVQQTLQSIYPKSVLIEATCFFDPLRTDFLIE